VFGLAKLAKVDLIASAFAFAADWGATLRNKAETPELFKIGRRPRS
jgi:hypothetical protein